MSELIGAAELAKLLNAPEPTQTQLTSSKPVSAR